MAAAENQSSMGSTGGMMDDAALTDEELQLLDEWMARPVEVESASELPLSTLEARGTLIKGGGNGPDDPTVAELDNSAPPVLSLDDVDEVLDRALETGTTESNSPPVPDALPPELDSFGDDPEGARSRSPLQDLTQDLRDLQHALLLQLTDDVQRLGAEKAKLAIDIDRLQLYRDRLEEQRSADREGAIAQNRGSIEAAIDPNAKEWAQQWAQQLAGHMGQYLNEALRQRFDQIEERFENQRFENQVTYAVDPDTDTAITRELPADGEALDLASLRTTDQMLANLDYRVQSVLQGLQRDLDTYESDLVQRLNRMHDLEQQGELVLQALVHRLEEVWVQDADFQEAREARGGDPSGSSTLQPPPNQQILAGRSPANPPPLSNTPRFPKRPPGALGPAPEKPNSQAIVPVPSSDKLLSGLGLGFLSVITLALFNGALKFMFQGAGTAWWSGGDPVAAILPPTGGNVLLVLTLRTLTVLLIFPIIAKLIYPPLWSDLQRSLQALQGTDKSQRAGWLPIILSGIWLFIAQLLGYFAITYLPLGVAIALFFVYPVVQLFTGWLMGTERQSWPRWLMGGVIVAGLIMAAPDTSIAGTSWSGNLLDPNLAPNWTGLICGLGSGIAFAGHRSFAHRSLKRWHPVAFTLISFSVVFILSCLGLILQPGDWAAIQLAPNAITGLIIGSAVLGLLTLVSYSMNNGAVGKIGPSLVAITGAFSPWLNALLGWILLGETLETRPNVGIALVTLGAIALSLSRFRDHSAKP